MQAYLLQTLRYRFGFTTPAFCTPSRSAARPCIQPHTVQHQQHLTMMHQQALSKAATAMSPVHSRCSIKDGGGTNLRAVTEAQGKRHCCIHTSSNINVQGLTARMLQPIHSPHGPTLAIAPSPFFAKATLSWRFRTADSGLAPTAVPCAVSGGRHQAQWRVLQCCHRRCCAQRPVAGVLSTSLRFLYLCSTHVSSMIFMDSSDRVAWPSPLRSLKSQRPHHHKLFADVFSISWLRKGVSMHIKFQQRASPRMHGWCMPLHQGLMCSLQHLQTVPQTVCRRCRL